MNIHTDRLAQIYANKKLSQLYQEGLDIAASIREKREASAKIKQLSPYKSSPNVNLEKVSENYNLSMQIFSRSASLLEEIQSVCTTITNSAMAKKMNHLVSEGLINEVRLRYTSSTEIKTSYLRFGQVGSNLFCTKFSSKTASPPQVTTIYSAKPSRPEYEHFDRLGQMWQCSANSVRLNRDAKPYNCSLICYRRGKRVFQLDIQLFKLIGLYNDNCMWVQDFGLDKIIFISYQTMYHQNERTIIRLTLINVRTLKVLCNKTFMDDQFSTMLRNRNNEPISQRVGPDFIYSDQVLVAGFVNDGVHHGAIMRDNCQVSVSFKFRKSVGYIPPGKAIMRTDTEYYLMPFTMNLINHSTALGRHVIEVNGFNLQVVSSPSVYLVVDNNQIVVFLKQQTIITDCGEPISSANLWDLFDTTWICVWTKAGTRQLIQILRISKKLSVLLRHGIF